MKIYLVSTGSYSDYSIHSIWSTREKADRMEEILKFAKHSETNDIQEVEMDKEQSDCPGYCVCLDLNTGKCIKDSPYGVVLTSGYGIRTDVTPDVFRIYFRKLVVKKDGQWMQKSEYIGTTDYTPVEVSARHVTIEQATKAAQDLRAKVLAHLEGV